jgi:hypothetical protein
MTDILFHCSGLSLLMGASNRAYTEKLPETAKSYLLQCYIEYKYGRTKDISSQYIRKGLMVEEDAITLYSLARGVYLAKNEQQFQNDYVIGTPDLLDKYRSKFMVVDTKAKWDLFTFIVSKMNGIETAYYWQLMGYMWLTGTKRARLANCLINTPEPLIADAKRKFMWNANIIDENEVTEEVFAQLEQNMRFDDIPIKKRLVTFDLLYDQNAIDNIIKRITQCRKYINETLVPLCR